MQRVHFINSQTFAVGPGWLKVSSIAVVRPVRLDVHDALCPACSAGVEVPPALAVRLVDGAKFLVLGDGCHPDARAVRQARALLAAKAHCDEQGHKAGDYVTTSGRSL